MTESHTSPRQRSHPAGPRARFQAGRDSRGGPRPPQLALLLTLAALTGGPAAALARAADDPLPPIADKTQNLERRDGLLVTYLDPRNARIWLELPPAEEPGGVITRLLYVEGLATGLGSNPVGLDRGQLGGERLVAIRRVGDRVLFEHENLAFRALSDNADERDAVRQSFATSVLWAAEIAAESPGGRVLVDFTPFVVRDAHGIADRLESSGQGGFSLDGDRSVLDPDACLAFPDNLEFEAILTFSGSDPGGHVRSTAPTGESVTLVQHHSLIRLPDDGYEPRRFDPRMASYAISFHDYAAPLAAPLETRWIARHRLEKTDPAAASSPAVEPIVYYLDRGAPEPVRTALLEGARWWADAFTQAGFEDAYRVELMPEGAHPLDVRYNVIQWVHRSTRGWSYGGSVIDPRTGEIIKGHVTLGSLRVRHDRLLFEGLAGTEKTGTGAPDDPVQLSLARLRQLSAHEVGHTLGFAHNFAASTYAGRASVMDYPAPLVEIRDGERLDFSSAYGVGVGEWDVHAVRYAYSQFPPDADEDAELERIVRDGLRRGLRYLTDDDARPAGAAHPLANLWDNGSDPVAALAGTLEVRRLALNRFGERNIAAGRPLALLHEVLAPLYLHHRYQLEAAAKVIGGLEYTYAVRGDGQPLARPVDGRRQRAALDAVLRCASPAELDLPDPVLALLMPRPFGYGHNRELFESDTEPAFDSLGAAATAAGLVFDAVLQRERAARLVDFHRRDSSLPGLGEVLTRTIDAAFGAASDGGGPRQAAVRNAIQAALIRRLITLAGDDRAAPAVRAQTEAALRDLLTRLTPGARDAAHTAWLAGEIRRFLERGYDDPMPMRPPADAPPGSPIGMGAGPVEPAPHADFCSFDPPG